MVSNGSTDINMTQLISKCLGYKGLVYICTTHLALVVQLGLHTILLIRAFCICERSDGSNFCKHSSGLTIGLTAQVTIRREIDEISAAIPYVTFKQCVKLGCNYPLMSVCFGKVIKLCCEKFGRLFIEAK